MIKAIIFDVGGVLVRTEEPQHRRNLEIELGLDPGEAEFLVFNSDMGRKAQHGQVTTSDLWTWLADQLSLNKERLAYFQTQFFAGDQLDIALVEMIRGLKKKYQTAIISNAADNLLDNVTRVYPMADAFGLIVGSAYEGIMKPDPTIYLHTLERLERKPDEAVFVDDFMHNVEGARAVGMEAIHFQPGIDLAQALRELGVDVSSLGAS